MKECICHLWQIHPFLSKATNNSVGDLVSRLSEVNFGEALFGPRAVSTSAQTYLGLYGHVLVQFVQVVHGVVLLELLSQAL